MAEELQNKGGSKVSHSTIKLWLNKNSIYAFSPIKKPLLSKRNIAKRKAVSEEFMFLSDEEIKSIIFSDESKFNLFYSDGKVSVWRKAGEGLKPKNLIPTFKYGGGSIMVWGCFSYQGIGKLAFIEGKMNAISYVDILRNHLSASAASMGLENYIFQQDNDPKHTSRHAKGFLNLKRLNCYHGPHSLPI